LGEDSVKVLEGFEKFLKSFSLFYDILSKENINHKSLSSPPKTLSNKVGLPLSFPPLLTPKQSLNYIP